MDLKGNTKIMKRDLADKYFNGNCTEEEAGQILDWFVTPNGRKYLEKRIEEDFTLLEDERIKAMVSESQSEQMWSNVRSSLAHDKTSRRGNPGLHWRSVAAVFLILTSAMYYFWSQIPAPDNTPEPIHYAAGNEQQRVITLGDGSEIRLNSNSEIWISGTFGEPNREVELKGEAYFEVVHDEEKPFVIHTPDATVKDLGTAFNVKAFPDENNVQVAVTEGKVTLWSDEQSEKEAVELNPGQFGFLNLQDHSIEVDEFENSNYLSWMNGRMEFDNVPLKQVCKQLSRIYGAECEFSIPEMKELILSSNFERGSLDKALEVISLTLELDYSKKGKTVRWISTPATEIPEGSN